MIGFGYFKGLYDANIIALRSAKFGMSGCISGTAAIYLVIGMATLRTSRRLRRTRGTSDAVTPLWPTSDTSEI